MVTNSHNQWSLRLGTFLLWALVGSSVAFWGLRLSAKPPGLSVPTAAAAPAAPDAQALARLLGASPSGTPAPAAPVATLASRFALIGVLAGRSSGGAALIAVDGKPAKPFRVGAAVDEGLVLQALGPRQARLGQTMDGPVTVTLEMPLKN